MFKVYVDGALICSSKADDIALISPVVKLEANKAGSFDFTFPADHPWKESITERKSLIDVYLDGALIFEGVATEISDDFYGQRSVTCEGELTFLNDSVLRQHHYSSQTPAQLLTAYINEHNSQVDSWKQFTVGSVTVTGSATRFTNYETTMKEIGDDLIDDFGGYLRVRHVNGVRYLDYLADSPHTASQTVALGRNLIDLKSNLSSLDICTVLIPLGAKQETQEVQGLDARLTIKSVNSGLDYLENTAAITACGRIVKTHIWDDVTVAANLKSKGQAYLSDLQYANLVIDVTAFDLGLASDALEKFQLLDTVRVVSAPHGLDRNFVITKMTLNLAEPEKDTITLGKEITMKISARAAQASEAVYGTGNDITAGAIYNAAVAQATALITSAMGGYVYKTTSELFIMDTADPDTATKVWRWNLNGLGYSSNGINGPYSVAMTMDGAIVANKVSTGILTGGNGTYSLNMETGEVNMASANITGGSINIETDSETADTIHLRYGNYQTYQTAHGIHSVEKDLNNNTYYHDQYAGYEYYAYKPAGGTERDVLTVDSMNGTGGIRIFNSAGNVAARLDETGLLCHPIYGTTSRVSGSTSWTMGSEITVPAGYYIIRAEAKVAGDYQYNIFGAAIYYGTSLLNYTKNRSSAQIAYDGSTVECVTPAYFTSEQVLHAAAICNTNAGLIDTTIKAMRIG